MSPKATGISKYTGKKYRIHTMNAPILVCDILGFKNLVSQNELMKIIELMMNVIDTLFGMSQKDIGKQYFKGNEELYEKLKDHYPESLKLEASVVSDTIIIYPSEEFSEKNIAQEVSLMIMSIISMLFFRYMLKELNLLIRGALTYGEYGVIDDPKVVIGKGLIEAYELEKCQDWGGIIPSPILCSMLKKSSALNILFVNYAPVPIKASSMEDFSAAYEKFGVAPHVLNWTRITEKIDWKPLFENAEKIEDEENRKDALYKITQTKTFYEEMKKNGRALSPLSNI